MTRLAVTGVLACWCAVAWYSGGTWVERLAIALMWAGAVSALWLMA